MNVCNVVIYCTTIALFIYNVLFILLDAYKQYFLSWTVYSKTAKDLKDKSTL